MKNFLIGLVVGMVLAGTGTYTIIEKKAKKMATKQNMEKVAKATHNLTDTIQDIVK